MKMSNPYRKMFKRSGMSWTDDLPTCELSDVGVLSNVQYKGVGKEVTMEPTPCEDYAFNFRTEDDSCYLYGVFDGHDGMTAAHFAGDRLPAELLLGQLNPRVSDVSIKNVLSEAFRIVERGYFESLDNDVATRAFHQTKVADSRLPAEILTKRYATSFEIIKNLDAKIKGGTTAVIALLLNKKLFVANVGNSRCLFCKLKSNGVLEYQQLSKDHDIFQPDEIARLRKLGVDTNAILAAGKLGPSKCTRSIGDYSVKGGYREIENLRMATSEPVTSDPDIVGGISVDYEGLFLILMSDAVYESVQAATKSTNPNYEVARLVSHEMVSRPTLKGVAQRVLDKIAHMHESRFSNKPLSTRGDMTMVVRNFSHPIGSGPTIDIKPDVQPVSVPFTASHGSMEPDTGPALSLVMPPISQRQKVSMPGSAGSLSSVHYTSASTSPSDDTPTNVTPVNNKPKVSSEIQNLNDAGNEDAFYRCDQQDTKAVDKDGRVKSYIKLDHFKIAWEQHIANNPNENFSLI